jgi:multiple sugar transport system substrate-binding protein
VIVRTPAAVAALGFAASACVAEGAARDAVSLELANWASHLEAAIEREVLDSFAVRHPGVRVTQHSAGTGQAEYRERILTSMAAGAPPDVFLLDNIDIPAFADRGVLLDLRPFLGRLGIDLSGYDSTVLAIFRRGDAVYALPKGYTPMVLAYNKDLFDRAGLPYPRADWTWDEFLAAARALTRDTDGDGAIDQWGTAFDRRVFMWNSWIIAGGGDVLCPDGARATGCLDSPATVEAIRWYTGWVTRDRVVPRFGTLRRSLGDNLRLFASGRVAMVTAGHFWVPNFLPYVRDGRLRVGFAAIPHREGVAPATVLYASGFAVPAAASHRRRSVELAAFLADSLALEIRARARLELPSRESVGQGIAAADTLGWEAVFRRAAARGRIPWGARIREWREIEAVLPELMDRITLRGEEPQAVARDIARRIDRILAPRREGTP